MVGVVVRGARRASPLWLLVSALWLAGCGNTLYVLHINAAEERFQEARKLEAEQRAPYEYYGAEARLREARLQAAEAEYGNASKLAQEARKWANRAVKQIRAQGPLPKKEATP